MKHTPGPWELADENNAHFEIQIGETICSLDRCSPHSDLKYVIERDEMIANGHLIMAAPDLLKFAQYVVDSTPFGSELNNKAAEVINKAIGE